MEPEVLPGDCRSALVVIGALAPPVGGRGNGGQSLWFLDTGLHTYVGMEDARRFRGDGQNNSREGAVMHRLLY